MKNQMRRTLAGPLSSNYKEKDVKVTKAIENLEVGNSTYLDKFENDIKNNPVGKDLSNRDAKKLKSVDEDKKDKNEK